MESDIPLLFFLPLLLAGPRLEDSASPSLFHLPYPTLFFFCARADPPFMLQKSLLTARARCAELSSFFPPCPHKIPQACAAFSAFSRVFLRLSLDQALPPHKRPYLDTTFKKKRQQKKDNPPILRGFKIFYNSPSSFYSSFKRGLLFKSLKRALGSRKGKWAVPAVAGSQKPLRPQTLPPL